MKFILGLLLIGYVWAATEEEPPVDDQPADAADRSVILPGSTFRGNCNWQIQGNPCMNNLLNRLNFPHPTDNTKFIQCGPFDRMFVIQCPPGEVYDQATTACVQATQQAVVNQQPLVNVLSTYGVNNPCTVQNIQTGRIFFSLSSDQSKFIQCDQYGNARVLTCPAQMLWDQNRQSCVFNTQSGIVLSPGTIGTGAGTPTGYLGTNNPCTAQAISSKALFFSHPDPTKFIQCDLQGNAFVQQCPSGLVWNQSLETCASQLASLTSLTSLNGILLSG